MRGSWGLTMCWYFLKIQETTIFMIKIKSIKHFLFFHPISFSGHSFICSPAHCVILLDGRILLFWVTRYHPRIQTFIYTNVSIICWINYKIECVFYWYIFAYVHSKTSNISNLSAGLKSAIEKPFSRRRKGVNRNIRFLRLYTKPHSPPPAPLFSYKPEPT